MREKQYDILYKGRKIFKNLDYSECVKILEELSKSLKDKFDIINIDLEES
jgi:hypothetical protein